MQKKKRCLFGGHLKICTKKGGKSYLSPIKTENFKFFINKSLYYFCVGNLLLLSEWPNLNRFGNHLEFWTKNCGKSHLIPIKTENFNFFINMSLSYFFLRNPALLSELPYFPKWPTYGQLLKKGLEHFRTLFFKSCPSTLEALPKFSFLCIFICVLNPCTGLLENPIALYGRFMVIFLIKNVQKSLGPWSLDPCCL